MQKTHRRLIFILTLATAIVAYSTNSLSIVFAYDDCPGPSNVVLASQSQVDGFSGFFGGTCDTISGSLEISGSDIIDLTGLAQIAYVKGQVTIHDNTQLGTLNGLSNLKGIAQGFYIQNNPLLASLAALTSLESVGYSLDIQSNPELVSIGDFPLLTQLGRLQVSYNDKLASVTGFALIERVERLYISDNPVLETIAGFGSLSSLKSRYSSYNYIGQNPMLSQIPEFSSLVTIKGSLSIRGNSLLTQISGFAALEHISGTLSIGSHNNLETITNFDALSSSGGIDITYNYALTHFPEFPILTSINGSLSLSGNDLITAYPEFANIETIKGGLSVSWNSSLNKLSGFSNLTSVGGQLSVSGNNSLNQLSGFSNLKSINGSLSISDNSVLPAVEGFGALTSISGYLNIYYNNQMENFDGLASIKSVKGDVFVNYNYKLRHLKGLLGLNSVGGSLQVYNNSKLRNMHALRNLKNTGGLDIQSNAALQNVTALLNLEEVLWDLTAMYNYNLVDCRGLAPVLGWPDGAFNYVGGRVIVRENAVGCNKLTQIMDSVTGPNAPIITGHAVSSEAIELEFDLATTQDPLFKIRRHEATCFAANSASGSNNTAVAIPDNGSVNSPIFISNTAVTNSDFISVDVDITHPLREEVELLLRSPAGTEITLWAFGSAAPVQSFVTTFPMPTEPSESFAAFNGEDFNGEWTLTVSDNAPSDKGTLNSWSLRIQENISSSGSQSPIKVTGLTNDEEYSCKVRAITNLGAGPVSNTVSATPQPAPPEAPVITRTDYGDGEIYLYVSADDNGVPITSYAASCTDGVNQFEAMSSQSPVTVTGLTNDVAYTCTVTATNSVGTSQPSEPSQPIIPEEAVYGLPIWLLYEASKSGL